MGKNRANRARKSRGQGKKFERNPDFFRVEPTDAGWPQDWICLNVMCRARFLRAFGESEFCPACRRCLPGAKR